MPAYLRVSDIEADLHYRHCTHLFLRARECKIGFDYRIARLLAKTFCYRMVKNEIKSHLVKTKRIFELSEIISSEYLLLLAGHNCSNRVRNLLELSFPNQLLEES